MSLLNYIMNYFLVGVIFTLISDILIRRTEDIEPLTLKEGVVSIILWPVVLFTAIKALF
jgi:hypothetical protein